MRTKGIAVAVLLLAAAVWGWRFRPRGVPTESELRQTAGVNATVVGTRPTPQGVEVTCRVSNISRQAAAQVVLRVALVDKRGAVLGDNPLAGVANLAPGEAREARFVVPCRPPPYAADARVAVSLVRWGP